MSEIKDYVLSLSYGKNSLACLGAIEKLNLPLTRIVHAEVWATDTISADLPEMVEFKAYADEIIKERWGIQVEHFKANKTYEELFYSIRQRGKKEGQILGFPMINGPWCNSGLKIAAIKKALKASEGAVQIIGIAADETERIERHKDKVGVLLPLVDLGWTDKHCLDWCKENELLAPIYATSSRGGCWFCHNQSIAQLRLLRKYYPDLWALMLKWDFDSPILFYDESHTVHDLDKRFQLEDDGFILPSERWRWHFLNDELNYRWF